MQVVTLAVGMIATNCYLVIDEGRGKAWVIDPGGDAARILAELEQHEADLCAIVLTHGHADHVGALTELSHATGAPILIHPEDRLMLSEVEPEFRMLLANGYEAPSITEPLVDDAVLHCGDIALKVMHTPGHTRGSCSLLTDGRIFCGDLLFAGSVGRTDLAGGDTRTLIKSIIERIMPLPEATIVHPGHGEATTVGLEKQNNPFLQLDRLEWRA